VEGGSRLYGGAQQVLYLLEGLAGRGHAHSISTRDTIFDFHSWKLPHRI
jgi:hypothetical protein